MLKKCYVSTESCEMLVQLVKDKIKETHIVLCRTSHKICTVRHTSGVLWLQKHCCILAHEGREGG